MERLTLTIIGVLCVLWTAGAVCAAAAESDRDANYRGDQLMAAGRYDEALAYWEDLLAKRPDDADVLLRAGIAYSMLDDFDRAGECLEKALSLNPGETKIVFNLALLAYRRGDADRAEHILQEIRARKPWYPNVCYHLGQIAELRGDDSEAMRYYIAEINNSGHGEAWRRHLILKRKLNGPAPTPSKATVVVLLVAAVLLGCALFVVGLTQRGGSEVSPS